jgi:hypothetical protein
MGASESQRLDLQRSPADGWLLVDHIFVPLNFSKLFDRQYHAASTRGSKLNPLNLQRKCDLKHPPGDEIYRNGSISMFEVRHGDSSSKKRLSSICPSCND